LLDRYAQTPRIVRAYYTRTLHIGYKVTYDGLTGKPTDVKQYRGMYILDFRW